MLALAEVGSLGSKPLVFTFNAWAQSRCRGWVTPWHQRHPLKPSKSFPLLGWNFLWDEMRAPIRLPQNPAPPLMVGCWGRRIGATRRVILYSTPCGLQGCDAPVQTAVFWAFFFFFFLDFGVAFSPANGLAWEIRCFMHSGRRYEPFR